MVIDHIALHCGCRVVLFKPLLWEYRRVGDWFWLQESTWWAVRKHRWEMTPQEKMNDSSHLQLHFSWDRNVTKNDTYLKFGVTRLYISIRRKWWCRRLGIVAESHECLPRSLQTFTKSSMESVKACELSKVDGFLYQGLGYWSDSLGHDCIWRSRDFGTLDWKRSWML